MSTWESRVQTGDVLPKVQHPNHPVGKFPSSGKSPSISIPIFVGRVFPTPVSLRLPGGQWELALSIFNLMSETQAKRDALIFNVAMYVSWHLLALGLLTWTFPHPSASLAYLAGFELLFQLKPRLVGTRASGKLR